LEYTISTNQWTWIAGDNTVAQPGIYGTKGTASSTNKRVQDRTLHPGRIIPVTFGFLAAQEYLHQAVAY
jgi:hypothetical protein